jgi:seryl-tRNA synthetase
MLDIKMIRQNFDTVQQKLKTRGVSEEVLAEFLKLD